MKKDRNVYLFNFLLTHCCSIATLSIYIIELASSPICDKVKHAKSMNVLTRNCFQSFDKLCALSKQFIPSKTMFMKLLFWFFFVTPRLGLSHIFSSLSPHRLMVLRSDPSIPPPTPHCPVAREDNMLEEAAAEAPQLTASSSPSPSSSSSPSPTLRCVSTELSRLTNSLTSLSTAFFIHPSILSVLSIPV